MRANADALKAAIPTVAEEYSGATGTTRLNDAGDRADGTYAYWTIQENGGQLQWTAVDQTGMTLRNQASID